MALSFKDDFRETFHDLANKIEISKINSVTVNGPHTAFICNDGNYYIVTLESHLIMHKGVHYLLMESF